MENPFEIILERLERIELAAEKLNSLPKNDSETLLSRTEACELFKINFSSLWKHTKNGILKSYGFGNRVYPKKDEVLQSLIRTNYKMIIHCKKKYYIFISLLDIPVQTEHPIPV